MRINLLGSGAPTRRLPPRDKAHSGRRACALAPTWRAKFEWRARVVLLFSYSKQASQLRCAGKPYAALSGARARATRHAECFNSFTPIASLRAPVQFSLPPARYFEGSSAIDQLAGRLRTVAAVYSLNYMCRYRFARVASEFIIIISCWRRVDVADRSGCAQREEMEWGGARKEEKSLSGAAPNLERGNVQFGRLH